MNERGRGENKQDWAWARMVRVGCEVAAPKITRPGEKSGQKKQACIPGWLAGWLAEPGQRGHCTKYSVDRTTAGT